MATRLFDTFTDADNTALTSHTPDTGGPWVAGVGTFKVSGNKAVPNSGANGDYTYIDAQAADFTLTCDVTPTWAGGANERTPDLFVRFDLASSWNVHVTVPGGVLQLVRSGSVVASASYGFSSGVTYAMKVICDGPTITIFVNGVQQIIYASASANQTATYCGMVLGAAGSAAAPSWDNFLVLTPAVVQTPPARLSFGPTRLIGLTGVPTTFYPTIAPPSRNSVDVQKYGPPARLSFGPTRLIGLTGVPVVPTSPANPAPAPAPQNLPPPVTPSLPNFGGLWLSHLPVSPPPPPNVVPTPPGPRHTRKKPSVPRVQSVGTPSDERRLGRMTEMVSNLTNALIRSGQLQQAGAADWKIIAAGFEAPRPPGLTDDSDIGVQVGSVWVDTTAKQVYVCLTNGVGSATWQSVQTGSGFTGTG